MEIRRDDPRSPAVAALLAAHLAGSRASTAASFRFALDADRLAEPGTSFFTAWDGDMLVGMGAIKRLGGDHAEVKSMRAVDGRRREGIGAAILRTLIDAARRDGIARLSLETGTDAAYAPARALYRRFGFVDRGAFADYPADSPHNCYMTLVL